MMVRIFLAFFIIPLMFWAPPAALNHSIKTMTEFWQETELQPQILDEIINQENCLKSTRHYVACKTALHRVYYGRKEPAELKNHQLVWEKEYQANRSIFISEVSKMLSTLSSEIIADVYNSYLSVLKDPHTYIVPYAVYQRVFEKPSEAITTNITTINNKYFLNIKIKKFSNSSCTSFKETIARNLSSINGLILDLRNNSGGKADETICFLNTLIPQGKILLTEEHVRDSTLNRTLYSIGDNLTEQMQKLPIIIFVNSQTASASEILAGVLQDYHRAIVIGQKTFGKGTIQSGELWEKNKSVVYFHTEFIFYLPSGRSPQLSGIKPDISIKDTANKESTERDFTYAIHSHARPIAKMIETNKSNNLCLNSLQTKAKDQDPFIATGNKLLSCLSDSMKEK